MAKRYLLLITYFLISFPLSVQTIELERQVSLKDPYEVALRKTYCEEIQIVGDDENIPLHILKVPAIEIKNVMKAVFMINIPLSCCNKIFIRQLTLSGLYYFKDMVKFLTIFSDGLSLELLNLREITFKETSIKKEEIKSLFNEFSAFLETHVHALVIPLCVEDTWKGRLPSTLQLF